jgi:hypothetical protein
MDLFARFVYPKIGIVIFFPEKLKNKAETEVSALFLVEICGIEPQTS